MLHPLNDQIVLEVGKNKAKYRAIQVFLQRELFKTRVDLSVLILDVVSNHSGLNKQGYCCFDQPIGWSCPKRSNTASDPHIERNSQLQNNICDKNRIISIARLLSIHLLHEELQNGRLTFIWNRAQSDPRNALKSKP